MNEPLRPPVDVVEDRRAGSAQCELEEARQKLHRLAADFDNFRKRTRREKDDIQARPLKTFLQDLLPILDDIERALAHVEQIADGGPAMTALMGFRIIRDQLLAVLRSVGLARFDSVGERFTPRRHDAVDRTFDDQVEPGHVVREAAPGYLYHDEVLRPARVVVSRGSEKDRILLEFDIEDIDETTQPDRESPVIPQQGGDDPTP